MKTQPDQANLWQELKKALASPESQQLDTAGKAIEQMVNVYALRFQVLMAVWEDTDDSPDTALPIIDMEALESWVRQSMSVDLDAFVEHAQSKRQRNPQKLHPEDSIVAIVEGEAVSQVADWLEAEQNPVELVNS